MLLAGRLLVIGKGVLRFFWVDVRHLHTENNKYYWTEIFFTVTVQNFSAIIVSLSLIHLLSWPTHIIMPLKKEF